MFVKGNKLMLAEDLYDTSLLMFFQIILLVKRTKKKKIFYYYLKKNKVNKSVLKLKLTILYFFESCQFFSIFPNHPFYPKKKSCALKNIYALLNYLYHIK